MSRPHGYPPAIFSEEVDNKYRCTSCTDILRNPIQSFCGHRFCKDCIQFLISQEQRDVCPLCPSEGVDTEFSSLTLKQTFPDNAIKRELNSMRTVCPYDGCQWSGSFKDFEVHYTTCEHIEVDCECGLKYPPSQQKHHLENECLLREVVCPYCEQQIILKDLFVHYQICRRFQIVSERRHERVYRDPIAEPGIKVGNKRFRYGYKNHSRFPIAMDFSPGEEPVCCEPASIPSHFQHCAEHSQRNHSQLSPGSCPYQRGKPVLEGNLQLRVAQKVAEHMDQIPTRQRTLQDVLAITALILGITAVVGLLGIIATSSVTAPINKTVNNHRAKIEVTPEAAARSVYERHFNFLIGGMDPDSGLLDKLLSSGVLSHAEFTGIRAENTFHGRNIKLLRHIFQGGRFSGLTRALKESNQLHLANVLNVNGDKIPEFENEWPLTEREMGILDANRDFLVDKIETSSLVNEMYSASIIKLRQKDMLSSKPSNCEKAEAIVDILRQCSLQNYKKTIECLKDTNQHHIATVLEEGRVVTDVHANHDGKADNVIRLQE